MNPLAPLATTVLLLTVSPMMEVAFLQSSTSRAVDQIDASSMRGVPTPPPTAPPDRSGMIWVPDRSVTIPGQRGLADVPGHWDVPIPESGGRVQVPALNGARPRSGTLGTPPSGALPPFDAP